MRLLYSHIDKTGKTAGGFPAPHTCQKTAFRSKHTALEIYFCLTSPSSMDWWNSWQEKVISCRNNMTFPATRKPLPCIPKKNKSHCKLKNGCCQNQNRWWRACKVLVCRILILKNDLIRKDEHCRIALLYPQKVANWFTLSCFRLYT